MKKVTSLLLALVMALALAVPAFAEEEGPFNSVPKTSEKEVTANYTAENVKKSPTVYNFTITWDIPQKDLTYYGEQATYTWDTSELKYKPNTESTDYKAAGWYGKAEVKVTVTNRSEVALDFTTAIKTNTYKLDIAAKDNITNQTVNSATIDKVDNKPFTYTDAGKTGKEQSADITYTIQKGTDSTDIDTATATPKDNVVATLTVTVNEKPNQ